MKNKLKAYLADFLGACAKRLRGERNLTREAIVAEATKLSKEYGELVAKVYEVDPKAAEYMVTKAPKLSTFIPARRLSGCFHFFDTPQGHNFWWGIHEEVDE